jgi:hypothetical protein
VTDAAHGAGDDQLTVPAPDSAVPLGQAALSGLRRPIVAILLLIALFTTISGKPLDGFLMLIVATLLVWDATRSRMRDPGVTAPGVRMPAGPSLARTDSQTLSGPAPSRAVAPSGAARPSRTAAPRRGMRRLLAPLGLAVGGLYAGLVGSFSRYSWPATIAVVALGCLMVAIGWQGPLRQRQAPSGQPLRRTWLWAVVLITGGLWELSSLLQQPHLTTDSYAHPTISALTDPLLASHPGRSVALAAWLLIGWFLVGR